MAVGENRGTGETSDKAPAARLVGALREALASAGEVDRYDVLATLFRELANDDDIRGNGRAGLDDELAALSQKIRLLTEEKAALRDGHARLKADLERSVTQLEAEQTRAHQLDQGHQGQKVRLEKLQIEYSSLEARLVAKNEEVHAIQREHDEVLLRAQRAELERDDSSKLDRAHTGTQEATKEIKRLQAELESIRSDKDAEIARLTDQLGDARSQDTQSSGVDVGTLWNRLAAASPPLVDATVVPTQQTLERAADCMAALVQAVDHIEKLIRPILTRCTKYNPPTKVPWEVFARGDHTRDIIMRTLMPVGGKPFGVAKIRLRTLFEWTDKLILADDITIATIESELHTFLFGPAGAGSDRDKTIKTFIKESGDSAFHQHMQELRARKLAELFGRGT